MLKIVLGLGNPGREYDGTPHNLGFAILDKFADKERCSFRVGKGQYVFFEKNGIIFVKPLTYMNLSGRVISQLKQFYDFDPENVLVIIDDINLPEGKLRLRMKGSDGGHNGLASIIYYLNSESFPRLRIGVGKDSQIDVASYVLSVMEKSKYEQLVQKGTDALYLIINDGITRAMNRINSYKEEDIA